MKMPPITSRTKLLSFDLESNGLHGKAFAVGALVIDGSGVVTSEYEARCPIVGDLDDWVAENVIDTIEDMPNTHEDYDSFCSDFWEWFTRAQEDADYVIVQNGYPVEYRFLLDCQEQDIEARYWEHPFPILDLTSMFVQAGYSSAEKERLSGKMLQAQGLLKHHPMHDAKLAATMAFDLLSRV